ncbi:MAG TPA: hypothetical protein VNQ79_27360 [Blastocatellia bacterium]|nr:hypothetical protein [Blastocatellia bacterium]
MLRSVRIAAVLLLLVAGSEAPAQTVVSAEKRATVTGSIKVGDSPMPGITVMLMPERQQRPGPSQETPLRAATDAGGQYRFTGVAAGRYRVVPLTEVYVVTGSEAGPGGSVITVEEGQAVTQVDFRLTRGGVITGRITDHEGRPMIAERITLTLVDENNQAQQFNGGSRFGYETDDRGIYRAYGLKAGRYLVSAGNDRGGPLMPGRRALYPRTFHPDVTDQSQATIVEVSAGGVTENVDIRFGEPLKTYSVAGRAVDADTGQPVAFVLLSVGRGRGGFGPAGAGPGGGGITSDSGEFRIAGLTPGRYNLSVSQPPPVPGVSADLMSDYYSEPVSFEIADADATGIEVRVHRGATITGFVVVEGAADPSVAAGLSQLVVNAASRSQSSNQGQRGGMRPTFSPVAPDGSFRISGLPPGRVTLSLNGFGGPGGFGGAGSFSLLRIERNGAPLTGDFNVTSGEQVAGIRLVVAYGSGVISGRVNITGTLPAGARLTVTAKPLNAGGQARNAGVDARGQFRFEGLLPGNYEVSLSAVSGGGFGGRQQPGGQGAGARQGRGGGQGAGQGARQGGTPNNQISIPEVRQIVTVSNGAEAGVTLTLNLPQQ